MVRMPWATYLWPGLPQLWQQGRWSALALAVGYGLLVNLALMASFVWVELLTPLWLRLLWFVIGSTWAAAAAATAWYGWGVAPRKANSAEAMFREALTEYLKENWFEAERTLLKLLEAHPGDVEARLLLATLLRHNQRHREALGQLARLELLRDASRWALEIGAEKQLLAEAIRQERSAPAPDTPEPETGTTQPILSPRAA
jgi:hypothetical protein